MRFAMRTLALTLTCAITPALGAPITVAPPPPSTDNPVDESVFPPGPEREFILDTCQGCHTANLVARHGGDVAEWSDRLVRMIRAGAPITRAQIPALAAYLAKAFPQRPRPQDAGR